MKFTGPQSRLLIFTLNSIDWSKIVKSPTADLLHTMYASDNYTLSRVYTLVKAPDFYEVVCSISDDPVSFIKLLAWWVWEVAGFESIVFPSDFNEINRILIQRLGVFYD